MNNSNDNQIDLSQINWNKLEISEFNAVEAALQKANQIAKSLRKKEKRNTGYSVVTLRGKQYQIKEVVFKRLKSMKSEKSKNKLIEEIISTNHPLEQL